MFLREATPEDAGVLLRLMLAAFKEYDGLLDPPSAAHDETVETVLKRLINGSAALATVEGDPAGFVFYEPRDTHLYFSRLSVLPGFRNSGVGRALIDYVEGRAREVGAAGVRLGVRVQLPHLIARYERLGYRITQHMTHPGYRQPTYVYMEKVLASGLL
jgi:GNAT superfamily N-acetyltransferase